MKMDYICEIIFDQFIFQLRPFQSDLKSNVLSELNIKWGRAHKKNFILFSDLTTKFA